MTPSEKIRSLRKYASSLPQKQQSVRYKIDWICNELERVRSGRFNEEELLELFKHLALSINQNSEAINSLKEGWNNL